MAAMLAFLFEHADLIEDIAAAIAKGLSKEVLKKSIRDAMVAASDAQMKAELSP
jgi:hypothetical protein